MAEEEEKKEGEEGSEEEGGGKKKNPMMLIIIGAIAVLLIVIIVVLLLVMGGEEEPAPEAVAAAGGKKQVSKQIKESVEATLGPVVPLKQFIVNLVSNDGRRYLKTEMQLELSGDELMEEAISKEPMARDVIIRTLSSKTYEEISTEQGKMRLKEEIIGNLNAKLVDGEVVNVYFVKFVVQ